MALYPAAKAAIIRNFDQSKDGVTVVTAGISGWLS